MDRRGLVILPLYVCPLAGVWDALYSVYATVSSCYCYLSYRSQRHPLPKEYCHFFRVQFTVVINIHNGPGEGALPNAEYSTVTEALNLLSNVRTIGYAATTWCTRDLSSVLDDIAASSV